MQTNDPNLPLDEGAPATRDLPAEAPVVAPPPAPDPTPPVASDAAASAPPPSPPAAAGAVPAIDEDEDAGLHPGWSLLWMFAVLLILFGVASLGALAAVQSWGNKPYGGASGAVAGSAGAGAAGARKTVEIEIKHGTTAVEVSRQLAARGVVSSAPRFMFWLRLRGDWNRLQAGDYTLTLPIAPVGIVKALSHGSFDRKATFPEGWTTKQIAARLVSQGFIKDAAAWEKLAAETKALPNLGEALPTGAQGYCFPETYRFSRTAPPEKILEAMLREFERNWTAAKPDQRDPRAAALSMQEIATLASIVEREARGDSEMPAIASVYLNRLQKDMKLQCCATVRYALGGVWDRPLSYADLKVDHPYNTYRNKGLPPGPIANPGRAALEAVLRPAPEEFLFYVFAGNGQHIFSKTGAQHEAAVRKIRKTRKSGEVIEFNEE